MWGTIRRYYKIYSELLDPDPREYERLFTAAIGGGCVMVWPERGKAGDRSVNVPADASSSEGDRK